MIGLNQPHFLDQEISRNQAEITKLTQRQMLFEAAKEKLKNIKIEIVENKSNGNSAELEKTRNEKFQQTKASIIKLWKRGDINWDSVVPSYQFADKKEAMEWFRNKIESEANTRTDVNI